jgi:hypothetical protein
MRNTYEILIGKQFRWLGRRLKGNKINLNGKGRSWDRSLNTLTYTTGLTIWESGFDSRQRHRSLSVLHSVQTGSGIHPTSYPLDTGGYFPGSKMAGAWSWPHHSTYYVTIKQNHHHNLITGWTTTSKILWNHTAYCLLLAAFLLSLLIDPADGSCRFFRNIIM